MHAGGGSRIIERILRTSIQLDGHAGIYHMSMAHWVLRLVTTLQHPHLKSRCWLVFANAVKDVAPNESLCQPLVFDHCQLH
jgi:hypothetical protein